MKKAHNEWKATRARRQSRIIGPKPSPAAPTEAPRERTLATLARHTGRRPEIRCILAEAASTMRRWTR